MTYVIYKKNSSKHFKYVYFNKKMESSFNLAAKYIQAESLVSDNNDSQHVTTYKCNKLIQLHALTYHTHTVVLCPLFYNIQLRL